MAANGIRGIDHLLVGTPDLEAARRAWARLGFSITPRGRHVGWNTGNYCIMFPGDYVELIGVVDASQPASSIVRRIAEVGEGMIGVALATGDAAAAHAALTAASIAAEPPRELVRVLELPEGAVTPRFSLVNLPAGATPHIPMFLCQHLSPELVRRPEWIAHANGATGVASVTAVVANPRAAMGAYARLLGPAAVGLTDEILTLRIGKATVLLARPADIDVLYPWIDAEALRLPALIAATFTARDLGATAHVLSEAGVPYELEGGGRSVVVRPRHATGVLVEFAEA